MQACKSLKLNRNSPEMAQLNDSYSGSDQENSTVAGSNHFSGSIHHLSKDPESIRKSSGRYSLNNSRDILDRPLSGILIMGTFFLAISLVLSVTIFVFYKKRNTVFVHQRSQSGDIYSLADSSLVIGHRVAYEGTDPTSYTSSPRLHSPGNGHLGSWVKSGWQDERVVLSQTTYLLQVPGALFLANTNAEDGEADCRVPTEGMGVTTT